MRLDYYLGILTAIFGAIYSFMYGDYYAPLKILAVFLVADFILGLIKGIVTGKLNSKRGYIGLLKKVTILLVISVANFTDQLLGTDRMFMSLTVYFYIALEGLSIVENISTVVPVPEWMPKVFEQLRDNQKDIDIKNYKVKKKEGK